MIGTCRRLRRCWGDNKYRDGAARGDLYVLAVGISKYRDNAFARGVRFAAQDAGALVEELRVRAAKLYDNVHVHTLLDDRATLEAMEKAFADFSSRISPIDAFVFFVAGHGTARDGQYHFIPADLIYENDDVLVTRSFNQARIEHNMKKINAERTVLVPRYVQFRRHGRQSRSRR